MSESELPEGWLSAPMSELAVINARLPTTIDGSLPVTFVPMAALSESRPQFSYREERPWKEVRKGFTHFAEGDVLFAKITPCMENGKAAVARGLKNGVGCGTTELHTIHPLGGILPEYIYYFLHQESVRADAAAHFTGSAGQLRVPSAFVQELALPLPPLAEQRRIVAKIEELLASVEVARSRLVRVAAIQRRFRQAVLAAACDGRLTADWRGQVASTDTGKHLIDSIISDRALKNGCKNRRFIEPALPKLRTDLELPELPETWCWVDLRFLVAPTEALCYGVVQPGADADDGIFLVRAGDLNRGTVDTRLLRRIPKQVDERHGRSRVDGGEILVTVVGAGIGTVAIVPASCRGFNIARAVAKIPIREVSSEYVFRWLQTPMAYTWMWNDAREVARPTLNIEQLETMLVPLPPLDEQREITRRIQSLFDRCDAIEKKITDAAARASRLTQSILVKAFRGELVASEAELARAEGRDFESAAALLYRIRAENEVASNTRIRAAEPKSAKTHQPVIERGRCVLDILLLLDAWEKPVSILALEPALVLMRNDAARKTLLAGKANKRRRKGLQAQPQFIRGLDGIYAALERNKTIRRIGQNAFELAKPELLAPATKQDRAKAAEVIQAVQALSDIRTLSSVVAAVTHERYEVAI